MALHIGRSRIPELLEQKGLSQVDLARYAEISESYVSQVISSKGKKFFSYPVAARVAHFLGCSMEDLHERNFR